MDLLEKASVILTPTAYNNGEALCVKPSDGSGDFDFSRNSAATRVNAQGLVENVQILSSNLVQNGDFSEEGAEEVSNGSFNNGSTDWTLGTGWSIGEDKVTFDETIGGAGNLSQTDVFTVGKTYKLTFDTLETNGGNLAYAFGSGYTFITAIQANTTHTVYAVGEGTQFTLRGASNFNGSITNISVKEVGMNWELGSGWEIAENKAISDATQGYITQTDVSGAGVTATYKAQWTQNITAGTRLRFFARNYNDSGNATTLSITRDDGTSMGGGNCVGSGTFTAYVSSTNGYSFKILAETGVEADITNISTIKITDNTNLPRINYENGCGSWLFEPQSTNLITQSELFSDASWANVGLTINNNASVSPEGVFNATKIIATTANSRHELKTNLATGNGTDMVSCFVKKSGYNYVQIASWANPSNYVNFDLANGSVGSIGTTPPTNYGIKDYGNGWYRIYANVQASGGGIVGIGIVTSASSGWAQSFIGNGIDGIEIWGAQVEQQSYATSYIPTNGSTVTRNQDVCNNGATGTGLINSTEGVLYWEGAKLQAASGTQVIGLSDGGTANRISFQTTTTANQIMFVVDAGGQQASESFIVSDITDYNKFALKWKQDDFSFWINGIKVGTDTSGNVPPLNALNTLHFYYGTGLFNFFGKTKAVAVWKEALSDSELQSLTTI